MGKASKQLQLGTYTARLTQLAEVHKAASTGEKVMLGLRPSDLVVPFTNKMDTGPPMRAFRKVRWCGVRRCWLT
jgi:hypothetical protein